MFLPLMHVCHNNRMDFAGGRGVWGVLEQKRSGCGVEGWRGKMSTN